MRRAVDPDELAQFIALCDEIEETVNARGEAAAFLARWNARAGRMYEAREFVSYYGAVDTETFVRMALNGPPRHHDDFGYDEAVAAVDAIAGGLPEADNDFALAMLECNLPGSEIIDLIYNPDAWFGLATMPELDAAQIVGYAMHRSGRTLAGAPATFDPPVPPPRTPGHAALLDAEAWEAARAWALARAQRRFTDAKHCRAVLEQMLTRRSVPALAELLTRNGDALTEQMRKLGVWPPDPT